MTIGSERAYAGHPGGEVESDNLDRIATGQETGPGTWFDQAGVLPHLSASFPPALSGATGMGNRECPTPQPVSGNFCKTF